MVLDWFESYLKNGSLKAKAMTGVNQTMKSDRFNITYGTSQGSCLGPLVFIIFMNDIHLLPLYCRIILFTDDTTIFNSHSSEKFLNYTLKHDLNLMTDWFKANKLSLNLSKTVRMKFWHNCHKFTTEVDNMKLLMVEWTKFLGVYIDHKLLWHVHLNHLADKLRTN